MRKTNELLDHVQAVGCADATTITLAAEKKLPFQQQAQMENAFEVLNHYYQMEREFCRHGFISSQISVFLPLQRILDSTELRARVEFYTEERRMIQQQAQRVQAQLLMLWKKMLTVSDHLTLKAAAAGYLSEDHRLRAEKRLPREELLFTSEDDKHLMLRMIRVGNRCELVIKAPRGVDIKMVKIGTAVIAIQHGYGEIDISKLNESVPYIAGVDHLGGEIPMKYTPLVYP